jgi:DinB superfamily
MPLDPSEYGPGFSAYISNVPEDDVLAAIEAQLSETRAVLESIGEPRAPFRYAPGKWSIKEVVGHFTDSERVFSYRAMAIARGEMQPLPGFDEKTYAENAGFDRLTLRELIETYVAVRTSTILLYRQLPPGAWDRHGIANNNPLSVRALAHVTLGHERHHLRVLRERYLA